MLLAARYRQGHVSLRSEFSEHPANRPMGGGWRDLSGLRKDGSEFPVEVGLASFIEKGSEWILATVVDVTRRKQAEALITADLRNMMLLSRLNNSLVREGSNSDSNLNDVVDTATAITGAQKGTLQLLDPTTGALTIAAQRGFEDSFLNFFASACDDASASAAMRAHYDDRDHPLRSIATRVRWPPLGKVGDISGLSLGVKRGGGRPRSQQEGPTRAAECPHS